MVITKREILTSVGIIAIMLCIGMLISNRINNHYNDTDMQYREAIQIDNDPELFEYCMDTSVGNAFIYGDLVAMNPVHYDGVDGEYLYIEKTEEHYNMHTRRVKRGKRWVTETYWTWDYYDSWSQNSPTFTFCGHEFNFEQLDLPSTKHIKTDEFSYHKRYVYHGVPKKFSGTIYNSLQSGNVVNKIHLHDSSIEEMETDCTSHSGVIIFWIFWFMLTSGAVYAFYHYENDWLEDKQ